MDEYLEFLVKKKEGVGDGVKKLGISLLILLGCYVVIVLFQLIGSFMLPYILPGIAAVVYGGYVLLRNLSIEYEYIITDGTLDVDIIKAKRTRKRLAGFPCARIELMAPASDEQFRSEFDKDAVSQRFSAVYDPAAGGIYRVLYTYDGELLELTFQPPEKMLAEMKRRNPRVVHLEPGVAEDWAGSPQN